MLKDHKAVTMVRLEHAALRSRVKHSTTKPLLSLQKLLVLAIVELFMLRLSRKKIIRVEDQWGPLGVLGVWGEGLFIYSFQGFGEQAHSFGDKGSPAKKVKNKTKIKLNLTLNEKPSFRLIFKKTQKTSGSDPPWKI